VRAYDNTPAGETFSPELCALDESERLSICEILDRVLNKGVVVAGEITISVADVDLIYMSLQLVLTSIETARESMKDGRGAAGLAIDIGRRNNHGFSGHDAGRV
jgi:gas vesicle structural protein